MIIEYGSLSSFTVVAVKESSFNNGSVNGSFAEVLELLVGTNVNPLDTGMGKPKVNPDDKNKLLVRDDVDELDDEAFNVRRN